MQKPCSFCWFYFDLYPAGTEPDEKDLQYMRAHLRLKHGLKGEVEA